MTMNPLHWNISAWWNMWLKCYVQNICFVSLALRSFQAFCTHTCNECNACFSLWIIDIFLMFNCWKLFWAWHTFGLISSMSMCNAHIQMQCMQYSNPIFAIKWVSAFDIDCTDRTVVGIINIHQLIFHFMWNDVICEISRRRGEMRAKRKPFLLCVYHSNSLIHTHPSIHSQTKKIFVHV